MVTIALEEYILADGNIAGNIFTCTHNKWLLCEAIIVWLKKKNLIYQLQTSILSNYSQADCLYQAQIKTIDKER